MRISALDGEKVASYCHGESVNLSSITGSIEGSCVQTLPWLVWWTCVCSSCLGLYAIDYALALVFWIGWTGLSYWSWMSESYFWSTGPRTLPGTEMQVDLDQKLVFLGWSQLWPGDLVVQTMQKSLFIVEMTVPWEALSQQSTWNSQQRRWNNMTGCPRLPVEVRGSRPRPSLGF